MLTERPKFDCAVFDLDGTLLYTLESIQLAINETMRQVGLPEHTLEAVKGFVNYGSIELVRRALPPEMRNDADVMRVHDIYFPLLDKYAADSTKPYDGIVEACRELKRGGVTLCVMSNKPDEAAKKCIRTFFGDGLFDVVRGSVPGVFIKPDKRFTQDVIREAGCATERTVFIGDSVVDLQTAANVGLPVIWVKWGYGTEASIGRVPEYTAQTPNDILKIILS